MQKRGLDVLPFKILGTPLISIILYHTLVLERKKEINFVIHFKSTYLGINKTSIEYAYMYVYTSYLEKSWPPGKWLPSLKGRKNDVILPKPTKQKEKIRLNDRCNF